MAICGCNGWRALSRFPSQQPCLLRRHNCHSKFFRGLRMSFIERSLYRLRKALGFCQSRPLQRAALELLEDRSLLSGLISVSIGDAQVVEGNDNSGFAFFNIDLNSISTSTVSVQYQTADGTAKAGQDYAAVSGTAIFGSGQRSITIGVPILGDHIAEAD